jgi:hypothetical protein
MKKTTETHKFKRGQKLRLDDIYLISGLAGGKWWTTDDPFEADGNQGEEVEIVEDITITITVSRPR